MISSVSTVLVAFIHLFEISIYHGAAIEAAVDSQPPTQAKVRLWNLFFYCEFLSKRFQDFSRVCEDLSPPINEKLVPSTMDSGRVISFCNFAHPLELSWLLHQERPVLVTIRYHLVVGLTEIVDCRPYGEWLIMTFMIFLYLYATAKWTFKHPTRTGRASFHSNCRTVMRTANGVYTPIRF